MTVKGVRESGWGSARHATLGSFTTSRAIPPLREVIFWQETKSARKFSKEAK